MNDVIDYETDSTNHNLMIDRVYRIFGSLYLYVSLNVSEFK